MDAWGETVGGTVSTVWNAAHTRSIIAVALDALVHSRILVDT